MNKMRFKLNKTQSNQIKSNKNELICIGLDYIRLNSIKLNRL